jgi:hypothetical protein
MNKPGFRIIFTLIRLIAMLTPAAAFDWGGTGDIHISELDFRNQDIRDILFSISRFAGVSLLPDETVSGRASYLFADISLADALDRIVADRRLFVSRHDGVIVFSRIRIEIAESGAYQVDAEGVPPAAIISALSRFSPVPVRWNRLPAEDTEYHGACPDILSTLRAVLAPWAEYRVAEGPDYLLVEHDGPPGFGSREAMVRSDGSGGISIDAEGVGLGELLSLALRESGEQYCNHAGPGAPVHRISIASTDIQTLLRLLLPGSGIAHRMVGPVHLLYPASAAYAPADRQGSGQAPEEAYRATYEVQYAAPGEIIRLLPGAIAPRCVVAGTPGRGSILFTGDAGEHGELEELIRDLDRPDSLRFYRTNGIAASQLIASLPPGLSGYDLSSSSDGGTVVIRAGEGAYRQLLRAFDVLDPAPADIEYHLLIVQFQENARSRMSMGLSTGIMDGESATALSADLSEVLAMNFDVLSNFGYAFSADLAWDLSRSRARIIADTSLRGREGSEVVLDNTSTFRYRDAASAELPVVREITTGLKIRISASSGGSGQLVIDVDVDISKRGVDASGTGDPPPTSSRRFASLINVFPGDAVVIADLALEERSGSNRGALLSGSRDATVETSRLRIYLIPYVLRRESMDRRPPSREEIVEGLLNASE